jgi:hypothetical protein
MMQYVLSENYNALLENSPKWLWGRIFNHLYNSKSGWDLYLLASFPFTPPNILDDLAKKTQYFSVLEKIIGNPNTSSQTLHYLMGVRGDILHDLCKSRLYDGNNF